MFSLGLDPVPLGLAGALTIAAIVGLGIFVYPLLLRRRGGIWWIGVVTVALAALFFLFDQQRGRSPTLSLLFAALWALVPAAAAWLADRLRRKPTP